MCHPTFPSGSSQGRWMSTDLSDCSRFGQQSPENRGAVDPEPGRVWGVEPEGPRVEVVPTLLTSSPVEIPSTYLWSPGGWCIVLEVV